MDKWFGVCERDIFAECRYRFKVCVEERICTHPEKSKGSIN